MTGHSGVLLSLVLPPSGTRHRGRGNLRTRARSDPGVCWVDCGVGPFGAIMGMWCPVAPCRSETFFAPANEPNPAHISLPIILCSVLWLRRVVRGVSAPISAGCVHAESRNCLWLSRFAGLQQRNLASFPVNRLNPRSQNFSIEEHK
jgi:hypothetical protein